MTHKTPDIVPRPAIASWIWQRSLYLKDAAELFGCSYEHVRRMCLPFGDPDRRVPTEQLMAVIVEKTNGEITPADFYPPRLNQPTVQGAEAGE